MTDALFGRLAHRLIPFDRETEMVVGTPIPWFVPVLAVPFACNISFALIPPFSRRGFLAQSVQFPIAGVTSNADRSGIEDDTPRKLLLCNKHTNAPQESPSSSSSSPKDIVLPTATKIPGKVPRTIVVPIEYAPDLNAYIVRYRIGERVFTGILDTGSPFLTVPSYCDNIVWDSPKKWGCYDPKDGSEVFATSTYERFDNNEGMVDWRKTSSFAFWNEATNPPQEIPVESGNDAQSSKWLVFGILEGSLIGGSGGVFFGLIRDTEKYIRPSFLGQVGIQSFTIDFINNRFTMTDQKLNLPPTAPQIPLVNDLRRFGDPALHYTAKAASVMVNGGPLVFDNKPTYVIFDTGVTGMVVSLELWEDRYRVARANKERSLWGEVEIRFASKGHGDHLITLTAKRPLTTPLGQSPPWKGFKGHLIIIGLAFLDKKKLSIDIDNQILSLE